jgi:hypothetical protein
MSAPAQTYPSPDIEVFKTNLKSWCKGNIDYSIQMEFDILFIMNIFTKDKMVDIGSGQRYHSNYSLMRVHLWGYRLFIVFSRGDFQKTGCCEYCCPILRYLQDLRNMPPEEYHEFIQGVIDANVDSLPIFTSEKDAKKYLRQQKIRMDYRSYMSDKQRELVDAQKELARRFPAQKAPMSRKLSDFL